MTKDRLLVCVGLPCSLFAARCVEGRLATWCSTRSSRCAHDACGLEMNVSCFEETLIKYFCFAIAQNGQRRAFSRVLVTYALLLKLCD